MLKTANVSNNNKRLAQSIKQYNSSSNKMLAKSIKILDQS